MKTSLISMTFLMVLFSFDNGCKGSKDKLSSEFSYGIENDITNLDPIKSQEPYSLQIIGQLFEGLVTLDAHNRIAPLLAEDWIHNKDFTVWKFKIRKGVYFHPDPAFGQQKTREVTAQDVQYSFQRIVSKDSYPSFVLIDVIAGAKEFQSGKSAYVSGIKIKGSDTVEFQLQQSEPNFLYRITSPWFCVFPKEIVEEGPNVFGKTKAVGTGPFRLVSRSDNEVDLQRNDAYWRKTSGNIQILRFKVIKNEQFRLSEVRNDNLTMTRVPLDLVPTLGKTIDTLSLEPAEIAGSKIIQLFPTFNTHFIGFNCEKVDPDFRRAISFAINRNEIVKAITNRVGIVTAGTIPIGLQQYQPPYKGDIFNLDSVSKYLDRTKRKKVKTEIELLVHDKDNTQELGELIQSQLAHVGIRVRLTKLDYNTVVSKMINGETEAFAMAFEYVFSSPEPILNNVFNSNKIPVPNFWRYKNPKVDELLSELRTIDDQMESNRIAQETEKIIIRDSPAAFLYQSRNLVIYSNRLSNVGFNGHSIPITWDFQIN